MSTRKVMVLLRLSCGSFTVNPLEGCKIPKLIPDATNTPLINKTKEKTTGHWISLGYPMPNRWLIDVCVRNIVLFLDYRCVRNIVCFLEWRWELGDDLHVLEIDRKWEGKSKATLPTTTGHNFPKGLWRDIETMRIRFLSSIDGVATNVFGIRLADSDKKSPFRLAGQFFYDEIRLLINRWLWKKGRRKFNKTCQNMFESIR